jgi:hypothetical protein
VGFATFRTEAPFLADRLPTPADDWLWLFLVFAICGALHVGAALMMAIGSSRRVLEFAMVTVGFYLLAPLVSAGHLSVPAIFQAIYIGLITLMGGVAAGLAWLRRWDERRWAQRAFTRNM